jgi:hypothetical protein
MSLGPIAAVEDLEAARLFANDRDLGEPIAHERAGQQRRLCALLAVALRPAPGRKGISARAVPFICVKKKDGRLDSAP